MKKNRFLFAILAVILLVGCSSPATQTSGATAPQVAPSKPAFSGFNREQVQSYSSTFIVHFEGPTPWTYQLKTRKSPTLREISLHIEGVKQQDNPGDVRMVTDGKTTWMIGPGTDQECVQFPNNQGMDPKLLYPESLVSRQDLSGLLKLQGEAPISGTNGQHFAGTATSAGSWSDVQVDLWQDKSSLALLKFGLSASGEDRIFKTGTGRLTASYESAPLGDAAIEPVQGCEVNFPLPDSVANLVRLPGMASFDSPAGVADVLGFYQAQAQQNGWAENEPPSQADGSSVLSYNRDNETVEIHVLAADSGGSNVKLLFIKLQ